MGPSKCATLFGMFWTKAGLAQTFQVCNTVLECPEQSKTGTDLSCVQHCLGCPEQRQNWHRPFKCATLFWSVLNKGRTGTDLSSVHHCLECPEQRQDWHRPFKYTTLFGVSWTKAELAQTFQVYNTVWSVLNKARQAQTFQVCNTVLECPEQRQDWHRPFKCATLFWSVLNEARQAQTFHVCNTV